MIPGLSEMARVISGPPTTALLLLCDNGAVLCAIKKWVGQGGEATLGTAPDSDILQELVGLLNTV